jgi:hypothetical protein
MSPRWPAPYRSVVHRKIEISLYQTKGEKNDKISLFVAREGIDPGN